MVQKLDSLPDYVCRQTVDRRAKAGKDNRFRKVDEFKTEVAFLEGRELYAPAGAGGFEETDFSALATNAAFGTGSFGLYTNDLFRENLATFTYAGESRLNGRKVLRYDYRVPVNLSRFEIRVGDRTAFVAYAGHFLADSLTGDVVQLAVHGQHIPPELSLSEISHSFEYKRVRIGDSCRQFAAESTVFATDPTINVKGQITH